MSKNLEKFRALHDFIENPAKSRLFGQGGLFGGYKEDHKVFNFFARWVDKLKKENKNIPVTINSRTFIAYLESQKGDKDNAEIDEIIKNIEELHTQNIITDLPLENNTLFQFAKIVDALNITDIDELAITRYNNALEQIMLIPESASASVSTTTDRSKSPSTISPSSSLPPFSQADKSNSTASSETNADNKTEINISTDTDIETETSAELPSTQASAENKLASSLPSASSSLQSPASTSPSYSPSPSTPAHSSPNSISPLSSSSSSSPSLASSTPSSSKFTPLPPSSLPPYSPFLPHLRRPKRIIRRITGKAGLRGTVTAKNSGPQRLAAENKTGSTDHSPATQSEITPEIDQFYAERNNRLVRAAEEAQAAEAAQAAQSAQNQKNNKNLAKRLAKIAGFTVGAGTIIPLFFQ